MFIIQKLCRILEIILLFFFMRFLTRFISEEFYFKKVYLSNFNQVIRLKWLMSYIILAANTRWDLVPHPIDRILYNRTSGNTKNIFIILDSNNIVCLSFGLFPCLVN
jgi:hypothetical protein